MTVGIQTPKTLQDQAVVKSPENAVEPNQTVDTATQTEDTGLLEKQAPEGISPEEIMGNSSAEMPKTDVEKAKAGTPKWLQKRIDKEVAEKKALRERIARLEAQQKAPAEQPLPPDRDRYETTEDWQKAMVKWQQDSFAYTQAQSMVSQAKDSQELRDQQNASRFISQAEDLKARFPDIYETIDSTNYGSLRQYIADSDHSARIGLYLARNPMELARLNTLDNESVINREIGKLEARFEKVNTQTTSAPPPLNTISGEGSAVPKQDLNEIKDDGEWLKQYRAEKIRRMREA